MKSQDERFIAYWAPKSKLGRWRYSLYYGAGLFGTMSFVGSLLFGYFLFDRQVTWERVAVGVPIWLITGFLAFGWFQWTQSEKRYRWLTNPAGKESAPGPKDA
jgi:hypothetical protein